MLMTGKPWTLAALSITLFLILLVAGCIQPGTTRENAVTPSPSPSPSVIPAGTPVTVTQEDLVAFVDEAVAYAKDNGRTAALAEFSNPNGSFVRGELYIYAYDFDGITLAHPFNPEKIGKSRLNETDAMGTYFIRNLRNAAENGTGFVTFAYINPSHNRTAEQKIGYVRKVDDTWWLGSGIYNGPVQPV